MMDRSPVRPTLCVTADPRGRLRHLPRLLLVMVLSGVALPLAAQPPVHYLHSANMPPGSVGQLQLQRGGPLAGYYQPVQIYVPEGAFVSLVLGGNDDVAEQGSLKVGLMIGHVYRLRVANIPLHEGFEVYPTVEVINRLYPPPGLAERYPIPIELTREDLVDALAGRYVTRVVYLEDPLNALPEAQRPQDQRYFDVAPHQDPLQVADDLGRPMAIVRLGSRVPDVSENQSGFSFGGPPFLRYANEPTILRGTP